MSKKRSAALVVFVAGMSVAIIGCASTRANRDSNETVVRSINAVQTDGVASLQSTGTHLRATVRITAEGFEPPSLVVPVGTTVTWTNDDVALHRIINDPADARGAGSALTDEIDLGAGDEYLYTFLRKGTVLYRDAYARSFSGSITVE